jgi:hypothetical protein
VTRGKTCGANYRDEVEVMRREERRKVEERRGEERGRGQERRDLEKGRSESSGMWHNLCLHPTLQR